MMGLGDQPAIKEDELTNRMAEMTPEMLIYASNGFLKQWRKFRSVSVDETNPAQAIFQMEELLKSMRKDLGHSSWLLDKGDVLAVFINDIDDVVK